MLKRHFYANRFCSASLRNYILQYYGADNTFIWIVNYFTSPFVDKVMLLITDMGFGVNYLVIIGVFII
jgi:hypothetical protein